MFNTPKNYRGTFGFAITSSLTEIAFPCNEIGSFSLCKYAPDSESPEEQQIKSHESPIYFIKFNHKGTLIAASSSTGQNLRIYDTNTYKQLYDFKRGTEQAEICDMSFTKDNKYFLTSSNRNTIHIFYLNNEVQTHKNPVNIFEKMFSVMKKIGNDDYVTRESSFVQLRMNQPAISIVYEVNKILAITSFGCFIGEFNSQKGGLAKITDKTLFDY